ncbi:MAG: DUF4198 domain-containing protein [Pseudomonadota bacterium]|nr:DUF4198 domain-containing protein [Pseudomonadota bacterium]
MIFRFGALAFALVASPAIAHDFWIQPERFQAQPNAPLALTFQVGHGASRERWGLGADRIPLLRDFSRSGVRDIRADLRSKGSADLLTRFQSPGLHVLAMQTTYSVSELPAVRFNDYAKEEGLALVLSTRQRTRMTNKPGRERYSRRAKALIEVGARNPASHAVATRPLGLKLEIVPERSPYMLGNSRSLPIRVMFKGRPLPNALVKLTNLDNDARPVAVARTDRQGRTSFRIPASGQWLLNTVWGEPVAGDPKVEFDTTFSSLTFGFGRGASR